MAFDPSSVAPIDVRGLSPPPGRIQSPFGRKTIADERFPHRFSQELRRGWLFRKKMAPERKPPSMIAKIIEHNAMELENPHFDTKMPPSLPIYPEIRKKTERSPSVVHGTLYRRRAASAGRTETGAFVKTLRDWTAVSTMKSPTVTVVEPEPVIVAQTPETEKLTVKPFEGVETRPAYPHITVRRESDV
jgi:hypothetical protein